MEVAGWDHAFAAKLPSSGEWFCSVSAPYTSGIRLTISRQGYGYSLDFDKPEWSLEDKATYYVTLRVDDLWHARMKALAIESTLIVPLFLDAEALSALRRGSLLTLEAEAETFLFQLENEAATLDRLESCYRKRLPKEASDYRNPFAAAQNPFKVQPRGQQAARSPTAMKPAKLEEILRGATTLDFRADHASDFTPSADLVYVLDGYLFGQYREQSVAGGTLDTVFTLTLASMQQACTGRAVSGRYPGRENELAKLRRGFISCDEEDFFADVLVLASGDFAMTFVTSSSLDDAELAETVGAAVGASLVP